MRENKLLNLGSCRQKQLQTWFESDLGKLLAEQEAECLDSRIATLFGYHVVQLGLPCRNQDFLRMSPARNRVVMGSGDDCTGIDLQADSHHLPLASDSVDGMVLPHTLDFTADPHQVLREVERVLIPEGKVLLCGFNPWSQWGLWRLLRLRSATIPWCGHFFSGKRIQDWFSLLGFELEEVVYLHFRPPVSNSPIMQRLAFMERLGERVYPLFGGVYVILAVKREVTMTPLRSKWRVKKRVLPTAAEPTMRKVE
ncbi:MAG: class I SAM-dependent methyltransferase [Candidatus Thiodiazotropha sp. (ex Cardiolucina cf. quadrata)]|nr:class I SAM-dependent methyltransferase [Candidatus Thiodiazotropha sp. (ex Cardiolucina cf. quadrata)]